MGIGRTPQKAQNEGCGGRHQGRLEVAHVLSPASDYKILPIQPGALKIPRDQAVVWTFLWVKKHAGVLVSMIA